VRSEQPHLHQQAGLAHVACLVRQAEMSVKEMEEWGTGMGIRKWQRCFDCGEMFHGVVALTLGWACWKTYLGRPEWDGYSCYAMQILANALRTVRRPEEALPVIEASLAVLRRFSPPDLEAILTTRINLSGCLLEIGRQDEALALSRDVYAEWVALKGVSHQVTITCGISLANSLFMTKRWDEARTLVRDQLLPVARQSLGADHHETLKLNQVLAEAVHYDPTATRDDLRLNDTES